MKTLILSLILLPQVSLANSQVGNFGHGSKVFGGSQGGTLGTGQGNLASGGGGLRPAERNLRGTSKIHCYLGGTGGGGVLVMNAKGTDNSRVGTL